MSKMFNISVASTFAAFMMLAHSGARAQVVETAGDFAKTPPYFSGSSYAVAGPASTLEGQSGTGQSSIMAGAFYATQSGALSSIKLALGCVSGLSGMSVALVTDNQGIPNEAAPPLEEWTLTAVPTSCAGKIVTFVSKRKPQLWAGRFYWLVVTPTGWDTAIGWFLNNTGAAGGKWTIDGGSSWSNSVFDPAFAIYVNQS